MTWFIGDRLGLLRSLDRWLRIRITARLDTSRTSLAARPLNKYPKQ